MTTAAFPHSPTWENLKTGIFVLPKVDADPYGTVGVWPDGTTVYWIDGETICISVYDRSLDTNPATGVGWTSVQLTAEGHNAVIELSPYSALSTAAVLTTAVKASAGAVHSIQCFNDGSNEVFMRIYNMATAPASTDAASIIWRGMIPGNAAGTGYVVPLPGALVCDTGIGIRVSGAVADNDTTALAANEVLVNVQYT